MAHEEQRHIFEQRLSPNQNALMRAIASGEAKHGRATLEIVNYTTLTALVKRGYVIIDGRNNLAFTEAGYRAYVTYQELGMPSRMKPGRITSYIATMFDIAQKVNGHRRTKKGGAA